MTQREPPQRPGPLDRVPGGDHTEFEAPVVRPRPAEGLDPAQDLADVPHQDTGDPAGEEPAAVHIDGGLHPARAEVPGPGVEVRRAADPALHSPVGFLDHPGVESRAGHHREMLAVHRSGVERAALPVQPDPHGLGDIGGNLQVLRQEVRRPGRHDGQDGLRPGHGVDAALDRPVAAPDEQHLGALRQRAAGVFRCLAALRHLVPERIGHALPRQHPPELPQAALGALARVCHDSDRPHDPASVPARLAQIDHLHGSRPASYPVRAGQSLLSGLILGARRRGGGAAAGRPGRWGPPGPAGS